MFIGEAIRLSVCAVFIISDNFWCSLDDWTRKYTRFILFNVNRNDIDMTDVDPKILAHDMLYVHQTFCSLIKHRFFCLH